MCLTIPARIEATFAGPSGDPRARVSYAGLEREVSLLYLPHAAVGSYVVVQAGFAVTEVTAAEAQEAWRYHRAMSEAASRIASAPRPAGARRDPVGVAP
jgi:hydrogenase expression/formation protein HypC